MYQDNGVNELATVCNVTFKGMELAGSFTKNTAKAFLKIAVFLLTMKTWAKNRVKDKQYRKAGKKKQKVMTDKYQGDVLYGKVESARSIAQRMEGENRTLTDEQTKRLPDNIWIKKRLEQLAKAHGLEYCLVPNKNGDELFIQYPKQQEMIFQEITAELQSEIKRTSETLFKEFDKENEKKCEADVKECKEKINVKKEEIKEAKADLQAHRKIKDKVGEGVIGEKLAVLQDELNHLNKELDKRVEKWNVARKQTGQELMEQLHPDTQEALKGHVVKNKSPMQYLEESGLLNISYKEFDEIMTNLCPKEYGEVKQAMKLDSTLTQEQKQEFARRINSATRAEARKNGLVVDVEVPVSAYIKNDEKSISFPHPEYPEFMMTVSAKGLCGYVDDSGIKTVDGKAESCMKFSVYKDAEVEIRVPVMDKISGKVLTDENGKLQFISKKMPYEKFDKYVKEVGMNAAAATLKKQRELQKATRRTAVAGTTVIQKGKMNVKKQ